MTCNKCKVQISGWHARCPLCQGDLTGSPDSSSAVFPDVPRLIRPNRLFLSVIAFISVVTAAVCVAINISLPTNRWWCLFVIAGIISFWVSFAVVIRKMGNIPKTIIWQVVILSVISVLWDAGTHFHGWSLDYVIPILCTAAMLAMAVVARIMKLHIDDYMIYLIIDIVLALVSLILLLCGVLNVVYPTAICIASSMVSLGALLAFEGHALKAEIVRRMHM